MALFGTLGGVVGLVIFVITVAHIILKQPKMSTLHKVLWVIASFFFIGIIIYWILWLLKRK